MDYLLRFNEKELQSTGFMEIGPGRYTGLHWQKGFVFVRDDAFGVAEGILLRHFPAFNHWAMNDIPKEIISAISGEWLNAADCLPTLDLASIREVLNLKDASFGELDKEVESHRLEVAGFLRALANECERFAEQSDWICILGM